MIRDEHGLTITAGDVRTPWLVRLFSRRERWFDLHRKCQIGQRHATGWDGSLLITWQCDNWRCRRYMSAFTEDSGYPFSRDQRPGMG